MVAGLHYRQPGQLCQLCASSTAGSTAVYCSNPPPSSSSPGPHLSAVTRVGPVWAGRHSQTRQDWTRSQLRGLSVSAGQSVMCAARQNNIITTDRGNHTVTGQWGSQVSSWHLNNSFSTAVIGPIMIIIILGGHLMFKCKEIRANVFTILFNEQ